jgi:hypothetical protein
MCACPYLAILAHICRRPPAVDVQPHGTVILPGFRPRIIIFILILILVVHATPHHRRRHSRRLHDVAPQGELESKV